MQKYTLYQRPPDSQGLPRLRGAAPGIYTADGGFVPWEKCTREAYTDFFVLLPDGEIECSGTCITGAGELPERADLVIPEGITAIRNSAFFGTCLRSVFLPDSLLSVGKGCFSFSDLSYVSFGKGLRAVGRGAFGCSDLRCAVLPSGISKIETDAFSGDRTAFVYAPGACLPRSGFSVP